MAYAQLGIWGYFVYGFSPIITFLRDEQGTTRAVASLHSTALAGGTVLGGLLFTPLVRHLGRRRALWTAVVGIGVAAVGLCVLHPLPLTLLCAMTAGAWGSVISSGVMVALTEHHGTHAAAALSEANAAASGLGTAAPVIIGACLSAGLGWRPGIGGVVILIGVLLGAVALHRTPLPYGHLTGPGVEPGRLPTIYWLAWTLVGVTCAVEVCVSLWALDVLRTRTGMTGGAASATVGCVIAGMLAGRLVGGHVAVRVAPVRLLLGALFLSAAGFGVFWASTARWPVTLGLTLLGLGNAMHYPLSAAIAMKAAGGLMELAAARLCYSSALATGFAPLALGAVADAVGTHSAFLLLPGFLLVAVGLVGYLSRTMPPFTPGDPHTAPAATADAVVEVGPAVPMPKPPTRSRAPRTGAIHTRHPGRAGSAPARRRRR